MRTTDPDLALLLLDVGKVAEKIYEDFTDAEALRELAFEVSQGAEKKAKESAAEVAS